MFDCTIFGARLRHVREEQKIPQKTVADLLHVTRTQISDMERGKAGTTLPRLVMLAEFFHVSTDYLLGITDDPTWRGTQDEE